MKKALNKSYAESQLERDREWVSNIRKERLTQVAQKNRKDAFLEQVSVYRNELIRRAQIGQYQEFKTLWKQFVEFTLNNDVHERAKVQGLLAESAYARVRRVNVLRYFSANDSVRGRHQMFNSVRNGTFDVEAFDDFFDRHVEIVDFKTSAETLHDEYWNLKKEYEPDDQNASVDDDAE